MQEYRKVTHSGTIHDITVNCLQNTKDIYIIQDAEKQGFFFYFDAFLYKKYVASYNNWHCYNETQSYYKSSNVPITVMS